MFRFFQQNSHLAILFLRLGIAIIFVMHGYRELYAPGGHAETTRYFGELGIPLPEVSAYVSAGAEFFGGCMIGLGLLTRVASLVLILNMLVAIVVVGLVRHQPFYEWRDAVQMMILSVATLFSGSGTWSLESLVKKHGD
jgi:putative oxidoreductase